MDQHEVVRQTMQNDLNSMPWDGSGPIDSLANSIQYFLTSYGPAGLSYQEIAAMVGDAYHYNGVPETGYQPVKEGTDVATGGTTPTGPTAQEIAAKLDEFNQNKKTIDQAYQSGLLSFQESVDALNQTRQSLTQQKDQGLENTSAYFSNVSPDAFQSQIGNYNQKVLDAYQGGQNTLANDQAKVDFYKQNLESNYADQNAALSTFNAGTGQYGTGVNLSPVTAAPKLTAFDTGISKLGAGQVPQWAPNYGGLSTMQAKVDQTDPYAYLKK